MSLSTKQTKRVIKKGWNLIIKSISGGIIFLAAEPLMPSWAKFDYCSIVAYCVFDIHIFSIVSFLVRTSLDFDVRHPNVNTEVSTAYLFNV